MSDSKQPMPPETVRSHLKQRSLRSGIITVAAQPFKLVVGMGATAVLARLVTPADFGLLAMAMPLLSLADSLSNFGLETATVQQKTLSHPQANAAFWFSLKINAGVIGLMLAMGWVLAQVYRQPALTLMTLALAVGFFSLCLSFQHKAFLKRQMRFELLTAIELVAIAIATGSAIIAAKLGLGYWALVLQIVVMQVVQGIAYWLSCRWRPSWHQDDASDAANLKDMFSYGAHLTGFRFITRIGMQLDRILVGYISGATALGFYDVAYRWAEFPFVQVYFSLFDVAVASLSRAYAEPAVYRRYCQWIMLPVFALCLPSLAFLYVAAEEVLLVLLGNQWLAAVPIFRLLVIAMFVGSTHRVTKWLYLSSGQTRRQLRWGMIYTPAMIVAVCIGAHWGAYGIAVGYTLGICLLTYPSIAFCLKASPLTLADFWGVFWRPALASGLSAAGLFLSQSVGQSVSQSVGLPFSNRLLQVSAEAVGFSAAYCLLWVLLPGGKQSTRQIVSNLKFMLSKQ